MATRVMAVVGLLLIWWTIGAFVAVGAAPERWVGTSTGDPERCSPFTFEIILNQAKISGQATSHTRSGRPVEWAVAGSLGPDNAVNLTAQTADSRISSERRSTTWIGQLGSTALVITQSGSIGCNPPRRASLVPQ
jgi:hypothetical protein